MDIDRTKNLDEIFGEIRKLAEKDLRIGQIFTNLVYIAREYFNCADLYYIENDKLLELIKEYNNRTSRQLNANLTPDMNTEK